MDQIFRLSGNELSVLRQLESNARMSYSTIGKKTRKSQQRVSYAVASMVKKGIITKLYPLIDYAKLGILSFRVYFKLSYKSEREVKEFVDHLASRNFTYWIAHTGGVYDLICTFFSPNVSQFYKNLRRVMATFPTLIRDYAVLTTIVTRRFGRKYLRVDDPSKIIYLGGDRPREEIDRTDLAILSLLASDVRMSSVDIARSISLTPKTVISRIKGLEKRKILNGYRPSLNTQAVGYTRTLLVIRYHNVTVKEEEKLLHYLQIHPHVISAVKTLGEWDLEIEIEAQKEAAFRQIEFEIRQKFASLIQDISGIPIYDVHKETLFPEFLN
ncbi:Lrp/AsnC family transcriptional regulator [Candidatus Woesearchaeota archaeon]|nr:Lrp/AsnC family transcriptional regulator [Candidatus Woesearchaeota archaeon]